MSIFAEVIISVFAVFGFYCALLEVRRFLLRIHRRSRKKQLFDKSGKESYNNKNGC